MKRREILRHGLTAAMALAAARARAQDFPKPTRQQAGYQEQAPIHSCAECAYFLPPDDCRVIQGPVSKTGTCIYFTN